MKSIDYPSLHAILGKWIGISSLSFLFFFSSVGCDKSKAGANADSTDTPKAVVQEEKKVLDGKYVGSGLYKYVVRIRGNRWTCEGLDDWDEVKESLSGTIAGEDLIDVSGMKVGDCDGRYVTLSASGASIRCSKE